MCNTDTNLIAAFAAAARMSVQCVNSICIFPKLEMQPNKKKKRSVLILFRKIKAARVERMVC
jgi:hypothetical protein